ncbi:hypothetical protein D6829_02750 [Candidatus Pacearchaeota archaeon]|nr:MAG: hypothetical protein D6829_02750 [Candidatus Pacearchaeota archaeon]
MVGKRGWLRIMEATIAIMIITGVLLIAHINKPNQPNKATEFILQTERKILKDIRTNSTLRKYSLDKNEKKLKDYAEKIMPGSTAVEVRICEADRPCKPKNKAFIIGSREREVIAEETLISSNLTLFAPKKVKIFAYQRR